MPDTTTPSSGIFSPGFTSRISPSRTSSTRTRVSCAATADDRFGRRQVHQRANRVARAIHRARLENLREREQERDRRALGPLADHMAPTTATSISTLMSSDITRVAAHARRAV